MTDTDDQFDHDEACQRANYRKQADCTTLSCEICLKADAAMPECRAFDHTIASYRAERARREAAERVAAHWWYRRASNTVVCASCGATFVLAWQEASK